MRAAFFVLLLANVALFAWYRLGGGTEAGGDAHLIAQQLNRDKIRLLAPAEVSGLTRKPEAPKTVCLEWGALQGGEVARAAQALEPLALGAKLTQRKLEESAAFWVYIPPLANRQAAVQKTGELKRLGVEEFFIIADESKWRNAVSLGVFKTEEAAKAHLEALRGKGVKSAVSAARDSLLAKTYFQVREAGPAVAAKLSELKQGFAGTEVRECAADEKKG